MFCCHGGQKAKTFEHMKKALSGNQFIGEIDFLEPIKYETQLSQKKAVKWARNLK